MSEGTVQLCGENKLRIDGFDLSAPEFRQLRLDVSVEGSVDLNYIKTARQNFQRMLLPALHASRIEDSLPVFVRPASRAHPNSARLRHMPEISTWRVSA